MHLSRRTVVLAFFVLVLGIVDQWTAQPTLAAAWPWLGGLLVGALALEGVWGRRLPLTPQWQASPRLALGQPANLELHLGNPAPRALRLNLFTALPAALAGRSSVHQLHLGPRGQHTITETVTACALGAVSSPVVHLRLRGGFGLGWWSRECTPALECVVVPDRLHRDEHSLPTRSGAERATHRRGGGQELLALREYRPGDPMRQVDWKSTARRNQLIVREFTEELRTELVFVLDIGRSSALQIGGLSRLHHYINIIARLAEHALRSGDRVALITYAQSQKVCLSGLRGNAGIKRLRTTLSRLVSLSEESNPLAGALATRQLPQPRSLVLWMSELDEAGSAGQLIGATRLLVPRHLPLLANIEDPQVRAMARQPASDWIHPYQAYAALQAGLHQQELALRMRRLGGEIVSAQPQQLDAMVHAHYQRLRVRHRV